MPASPLQAIFEKRADGSDVSRIQLALTKQPRRDREFVCSWCGGSRARELMERAASEVRFGICGQCLLRRHEQGYVAEGPGFYVWDEDPAEVIRVAEELLSHCLGRSRTARWMQIREDEPVLG